MLGKNLKNIVSLISKWQDIHLCAYQISQTHVAKENTG